MTLGLSNAQTKRQLKKKAKLCCFIQSKNLAERFNQNTCMFNEVYNLTRGLLHYYAMLPIIGCTTSLTNSFRATIR